MSLAFLTHLSDSISLHSAGFWQTSLLLLLVWLEVLVFYLAPIASVPCSPWVEFDVSFIPYSFSRFNIFAFRWFLLCAVFLLFTEGLTLFSTIPPASNRTIPCFDFLFERTCLLHFLIISSIQSLCIRLVSGRRHC